MVLEWERTTLTPATEAIGMMSSSAGWVCTSRATTSVRTIVGSTGIGIGAIESTHTKGTIGTTYNTIG